MADAVTKSVSQVNAYLSVAPSTEIHPVASLAGVAFMHILVASVLHWEQ